mgnify:CR=1 FL=1
MVIFRFIRRRGHTAMPKGGSAGGPSRVALVSAAGITLAVTILILSA